MSYTKIPRSVAIEAAQKSKAIAALVERAKLGTGPARNLEVDLDNLSVADLTVLNSLVKGRDTPYAQSIRFAYSAVNLTADKDEPIKNTAEIYSALRAAITQSKRQWLYSQGSFNAIRAYVVTNLTQTEASYGNTRARDTTLSLSYSHVWSANAHETRHTVGVYSLRNLYRAKGVSFKEIMSRPVRKHENPTLIDVVMLDDSEAFVTASDVLKSLGLFLETDGLAELYDQQWALMSKLCFRFGQQLEVRGADTDGVSMLTEGLPSKCILDTIPHYLMSDEEGVSDSDDEDDEPPRYKRAARSGRDTGSDGLSTSMDVLRRRLVDDADLKQATLTTQSEFHKVMDQSDTLPYVAVPMHFILRVFHLEKYGFYHVHVKNLRPYKYRENLSDLLILDDEDKETATMLVDSTSDDDVQDIIEGKSQAVIITCIGGPGLGKTLLAEVLAEDSRRPLYKVPADQLGLDSNQLEKTLTTILRRAERWRCVLMIDEANAYVHARGHDIVQNALVGVFLRRLEYYKGVLVLTTNQTTEDGNLDIDDAILSRSNAVIRFKKPSLARAAQIWKNQAALLKVDVELDWAKVAKETNVMPDGEEGRPGRSIRQLLRLSMKRAAYRKTPLTLDIIKSSMQYIVC